MNYPFPPLFLKIGSTFVLLLFSCTGCAHPPWFQTDKKNDSEVTSVSFLQILGCNWYNHEKFSPLMVTQFSLRISILAWVANLSLCQLFCLDLFDHLLSLGGENWKKKQPWNQEAMPLSLSSITIFSKHWDSQLTAILHYAMIFNLNSSCRMESSI